MKTARVLGVWGSSIVVGAGLLWACSSSTTETPGGGGADQDATTGSDTGSQSYGDSGSSTIDSGKITPKKDGGTGTDGGGTGVCGASATANDCYTCCDTVASDGGVSDFLNLQTACICSAKHCDTNATCKKTLCANPDTDDAGAACDKCQDKEFADDAGDAGCNDPVINECAADPNCNAGVSCIVEANCNALP
jgi:hypothetical protein